MSENRLYSEPRQPFIAFLSNPLIDCSPEQLQIRKHMQELGGMDNTTANPSTIHIFKERHIPSHYLYAAIYENELGQQRYAIGHVYQDVSEHWKHGHLRSGRWPLTTSGAVLDTGQKLMEQAPISFSIWNKQDPFLAEAQVLDTQLGVTRICLTSSTGAVLEDHVEERCLLFLTELPFLPPIEVELYRGDDTLIDKRPLRAYFPEGAQLSI